MSRVEMNGLRFHNTGSGGFGWDVGWDIGTVAQFVGVSAASGVVGSVATVTLRDLLRQLRRRLERRELPPLIREVAKLAVAAKLDAPTDLRATDTIRLDDHWAVTVEGGGRTYRVRIPSEDPSDRTISIDMD